MEQRGDRPGDKYAERKRRNEESRRWATRNGEPWSDEEDDLLLREWILIPPASRDESTVSQIVERTIESCRVRCEKIRERLGIQEHDVVKEKDKRYIGAADADDDQWWSPDYYTKEM